MAALVSYELTDVQGGEPFTLGELARDAPVLVETMAIWCVNCHAQQRQVVAAHGLAEFHSVSIDVDPNERAGDLARYASEEGFDWRFALADATLAGLLREAFSPGVLHPPSMPKLIVRSDGSVELLELGRLYQAEELVVALAE